MSTSVPIRIPRHNKCDYVAVAIESALTERYPFEVIIIDGGSTDLSLEEIKRFEGRVRWVTGPNRGGSSARNIDLNLATSERIQFLGADDTIPLLHWKYKC